MSELLRLQRTRQGKDPKHGGVIHSPERNVSIERSIDRSPLIDANGVGNGSYQDTNRLQLALGNRVNSSLMATGGVQAKLRIGAPNDEYEQEADRIAEQVMRMPEPGLQRKPAWAVGAGPSCRDDEILKVRRKAYAMAHSFLSLGTRLQRCVHDLGRRITSK